MARRIAHLFGFHHDPGCRGYAGCEPRQGLFRLYPRWYR